METKNFLKKITDAAGIPGFELEVKEVLKDYLEGFADVEQDRLGSLVFRKTGD